MVPSADAGEQLPYVRQGGTRPPSPPRPTVESSLETARQPRLTGGFGALADTDCSAGEPRPSPQEARAAFRRVGPAVQTEPMARRMTQVFHGWDQRDVTVILPAGHEHPGEHPGLLRAWAVDDETGESWGMGNYYAGVGMQYLDWIHEDHLRPSGDLTDDDGLVGPVEAAPGPAPWV